MTTVFKKYDISHSLQGKPEINLHHNFDTKSNNLKIN